MRVWIEISYNGRFDELRFVTLSVRVWIEMFRQAKTDPGIHVTLSVRVWIEMPYRLRRYSRQACHPLREGVD